MKGVDDMKKILRSTLVLLFIGSIILGTIKLYPVVATGYDMYQSAVNNKSIIEKVDEIKNKDHYIGLKEIPKAYQTALLKSEDKRFYYHFGMDPLATARAMFNNIIERRYAQGGSTLTQQLAKNMYFSFDKKVERKVAELFVAFDLERQLTKDEILELYCNIAYFGEGCYGLEEASNHYYSVSPEDLNQMQIEALVWTLKSPNNYNPNVYEKAVLKEKLIKYCAIQTF